MNPEPLTLSRVKVHGPQKFPRFVGGDGGTVNPKTKKKALSLPGWSEGGGGGGQGGGAYHVWF